jgi:hypothetical protein
VRLRLAALCVATLALPLSAGASTGFRAVFSAATHTPRVNTNWRWSLKVTSLAGRPLAARITVQLLDPYGGVHPVEFGCCKRLIVGHRITGSFRDYVKFPPEAQGFKLRFRVIVKAAGTTRVLTYWVRPA